MDDYAQHPYWCKQGGTNEQSAVEYRWASVRRVRMSIERQ
jgi:hypothetical protein